MYPILWVEVLTSSLLYGTGIRGDVLELQKLQFIDFMKISLYHK